MPSRPIHTKGTLHKINSTWQIELTSDHPSFEEGMDVELVLWDSRDEGGRSEVEVIARVQQLEPSIVALTLASEGSLSKSDFESRIRSI